MAGEKILIVEAEQKMAQLRAVLMQESGYQTRVAHDSAEGLAIALRERPDLIFLDWNLLQADGLQLLYNLRERQINVPVVIIAAQGTEELGVQALRLGVRDYVEKSLDLEGWLEVTERALAGGRLQRTLDAGVEQLLRSNKKLEMWVRQFSALYEVGQALASTLDPDELLDVILQEACRVLNVSMSSIFWLDERGRLVFRAGTGAGAEKLLGLRLAPGQGISGWVAQHGKPLLVRQAQSDPRFSPAFDEITGFVTESILCVPLMIKGRVIGVVEALNKAGAGFTKDDLTTLSSLAASAAMAIENTRLFQEEQERARTLNTLLEVEQQITNAIFVQPKAVLESVVRGACEVTGAACAVVYPYLASRRAYVAESIAAYGLLQPDVFGPSDKVRDREMSLAARIIDDPGGIRIITDIGRDDPDLLHDSRFIEREQIKAFVGVRLDTGGEPVGVLFVNWRQVHHFSTDEHDLIRVLANHAAIAIQNARLYERTSDQLQLRVEALERQRSLLEVIHNANKAISSSLDLDLVLDQLAEQVGDVLKTDTFSIALRDEQTGDLTFVAASGPGADILKRQRLERGQGIAGWVAEHGQPILVLDASKDPRFFPGMDEKTGFESQSILCVPMSVEERVIGVIEAVNLPTMALTQEHKEMLEALAGLAAVAIANARQYEKLKSAQDKTAAAEAVAWMGIFGSNLAHRINQLTFSIRSYLATLRTIPFTEGSPGELFDLIEEVTKEIEHIPVTSRLPDTPGAVRSPVEIDTALRKQVEKWSRRWDNVERVYHLQCAGAQVAIDQDWLEIALEKLINNAFKAMTDGGRLEVISQQFNGGILVRLIDTGPGIPDAAQDYFLKRPIPKEIKDKLGTSGTGVGVLIAQLILRHYGGDLKLAWSERGKGTALDITLPCVPVNASEGE